MKKLNIPLIGLALLAGASLSSCHKSSVDKVSLIPVKISDDKWSFVDKNGKIVFEDEFNHRPSVVYNGVFSVEEKDDEFTVYKVDGSKYNVLGEMEGLAYVGYLEDDLIPATMPGERISVYDSNGHKKFEVSPISGKEVEGLMPGYSEGLIGFKTEEDKWGFLDKEGKVAIKASYDRVGVFQDGMALTLKKDEKDSDKRTYAVIDKEGNVVFKLKEKQYPYGAMNNGYLVVHEEEEDRSFVYNKKGEITKFTGKLKNITYTDGKFVIFKDEGNYGVATFDGEIILRPKYEEIIPSNADLYSYSTPGGIDGFLCQTENDVFLFNTKGEQKEKYEDARSVIPFGKFGYFVRDDKNYSQINKNGRLKCNEDFNDFSLSRCPGYEDIVKSDYVDYSSITSKIAGMISDNGIGRYTLGMSPSSVFQGKYPENYTYITYGELDDLSITEDEYSMNGSAEFTDNLASYNYDYNTYVNSYVWNPNSRLSTISLEVDLHNKEWGKKGNEALASALEKKGFKKEKDGFWGYDPVVALKKGNTGIVLKGDDDDFTLVMFDLNNPSNNSSFQDIISQIKSSKNEESDYSSGYSYGKKYDYADSITTVNNIEEIVVSENATVEPNYYDYYDDTTPAGYVAIDAPADDYWDSYYDAPVAAEQAVVTESSDYNYDSYDYDYNYNYDYDYDF